MVLIREGEDTRTSGRIHVAVVKVVILYGLETWVTTPRIERVLGGFHHRVDHSMTGKQPWRGRDGGWVNLPLTEAKEEAMAEAGFQDVETYVYRN